MKTPELLALSWPLTQLGDAMTALTRKTRLGTLDCEVGNPSGSPSPAGLKNWIYWAASRLGCEAVVPEIDFRCLSEELSVAYPALVRLSDDVFLAIADGSANKLTVLTPALFTRQISVHDLVEAVREPLEREQRAQLAYLMEEAAISLAKRSRTLRVLLDEQAAGKRFDQCWILRGRSSKSVASGLSEAGVMRNAGGLIVAHTAQYLLWLASWAVLGSLSFSGRMERGWLLAWALLLLTMIPCQSLTTWLQGLFAIGLGGWVKARLLRGSMQLAPEELRHRGIGSFLGQVFEGESLETLAVSGGVAGLLAVIEIAMAMFLLGRFALVLAAWSALTLFFGWRFMRHYAEWTRTRMDMTQDLVESMVGHRTRLVQQPQADWHKAEDLALERYVDTSRRMDYSGGWLAAVVPRGWLLVGLGCIAPSVIAGGNVTSQIAILLGGVLLAYTALRKLAGSFADVAAAWVAWKRIRPLLEAAGREEVTGEVPSSGHVEAGQKLIEADRLTFRYQATGSAALRGCSLLIRAGEKILLQGPSGGGKTTFASLLTGLRQPESGLLLVNGLDRHTLGTEDWRRIVAAAPQFHENYILTETLGFNLLMGRNWPPAAEDLAEAEELCRELGLGDLLARMPSGLLQMVGEGGWQLSHGEKSRIYVARALLQRSALVILDESFAALDPESLKRALECTLKRANTLMVIAHP